MDLFVFTEPQQGATHDDLLRVAQAAESLGFAGFFRSDHYLAMDVPGLPGPSDAWLTLAALARETSRLRLGTLVSSATFRLPGPLAISVAQVDQMSGGRVELGLGAGWYEGEHRAYGIPFPPVGERFDRLTEQLAVIDGLWRAEGPFSYAGSHYTLTDSPGLPKPVQRPRPPIIMGGRGKRRTPALTVRYADEFNVPFASPAATGDGFDLVRAAASAAGRAGLRYSAAQTLCIGRDDAEVRRRADRIGRDPYSDGTLGGTVGQVVDRLGQFAGLGATRMYLQVLDLQDLDALELVAAEVAPQL